MHTYMPVYVCKFVFVVCICLFVIVRAYGINMYMCIQMCIHMLYIYIYICEILFILPTDQKGASLFFFGGGGSIYINIYMGLHAHVYVHMLAYRHHAHVERRTTPAEVSGSCRPSSGL